MKTEPVLPDCMKGRLSSLGYFLRNIGNLRITATLPIQEAGMMGA